MEFTQELLEKARKAESAEALQTLAKENGYDMGEEEANAYFAEMHKSGELSDEELENVSGGGCRKNGHLVVSAMYSCDKFKCGLYGVRIQYPWDRGCYVCNKDVCREPVRACIVCHYCKVEKGLWLCYNAEK